MRDNRARFDDGLEVRRGVGVLFPWWVWSWFAVMALVVVPAAAEQPDEETTDPKIATVDGQRPASAAVSLELRRPRDVADQRTLRFIGGAGVSVAHALNRNLAAQASLDLMAGQRNTTWVDAEGALEEPVLRAGIGGSVNLDGWPEVPLGLKLEYRFEEAVTWAEDRITPDSYGSHLVGGGLYVTTTPTSSVGLTASGRLGGEPDPFTHITRVGFVLQGYL